MTPPMSQDDAALGRSISKHNAPLARAASPNDASLGGSIQPGGAEGHGSFSPGQRAFLHEQRVGRLATVDPAGHPHAVPICYAELDGLVYTPIDEKPKSGDPRELRRIRNLLANPRVCLVVDRYDDDWTRLRWLQVRGTAALVDAPDERARAHAALRARYPQYRTMALEALPLIRITPTRLVGWSWSPA